MQITKATIIKGFGADKVILFTDLPSACYPYKGNQSLSFDTAKDTANDYMRIHFADIPYTIVERINTTPKYSDKDYSHGHL